MALLEELIDEGFDPQAEYELVNVSLIVRIIERIDELEEKIRHPATEQVEKAHEMTQNDIFRAKEST